MTHFSCWIRNRRYWITLGALGIALSFGAAPAAGVDEGVEPGPATSSVPGPADDPAPLGSTEEIDQFLERFFSDSSRAMGEPLARWDEFGRKVDHSDPNELAFSRESVDSGSAHEARDQFRSKFCDTLPDGTRHCLSEEVGTEARAPISGNDRPEDLIDPSVIGSDGSGMLRTLEDLEQEGLRRSGLSRQPWSGDYWPMFRGMIGARYGDPQFRALEKSWGAYSRYVRSRPARSIFNRGSDADVDRLSPSEKYELLVGGGSASFPLTISQWEAGESELSQKGKMEPWMGLCHGWAAAAVMMPRPTGAVRVPSADGKRMLNFYPDDIKALASLLWAQADFDYRFIGGRCRSRAPKRDSNGRVTDPDCFDTNPGTWHLAVTHQLGKARRALVIDSSLDYEIWNQPVLGYRYSYFNPQTGKVVSSLKEARVPMRAFSRDKFRRYRSSSGRAVVGIVMDLTYVRGTNADQEGRDSASKDRLRTVRYVYDLELDSSGEIIGGEWYSNLHPDFLWVPAEHSRAESSYESEAQGSWNPTEPLPSAWRSAAQSAAKEGIPLGKIVEALFSRSARR